ncbi:MAG: DUF6913 domain-containing protein [Bacteroidia bacterium]
MNPVTRYIANWQIKKLCAASRAKQFIKLSEAKKVGLLFDATDKEAFEIMKKFIQQLKENVKGVHAIGFVDDKITPNYSYVKSDIDLFNKKELKNGYQPLSLYIKTFIEDDKDILIDANIGGKLPLKYIAAASRAKCKVGMHTAANESLYDVLLATSPAQGLEFYLQQSLKYLT